MTAARRPAEETARLVVQLRRENPCATQPEIARLVGVTKQYVSKVLKRAGLPTGAYHARRLWTCPVCGTVSERQFCGGRCLKRWHTIPLRCDQCGKLYSRPLYFVLQAARRGCRRQFCSTRCAGVWWGKRFGSARRGVRTRRINHAWVRQVYLLSGWPPGRVADYLGLKYATVVSILYKHCRPS